jgi:hypothetical protein
VFSHDARADCLEISFFLLTTTAHNEKNNTIYRMQGIAAPQIGIPLRMIALNLGNGPLALANPVLSVQGQDIREMPADPEKHEFCDMRRVITDIVVHIYAVGNN